MIQFSKYRKSSLKLLQFLGYEILGLVNQLKTTHLLFSSGVKKILKKACSINTLRQAMRFIVFYLDILDTFCIFGQT